MGVIAASVVVDVVGRLGESGAEGVDEALKPREQLPVGRVDLAETLARGLGLPGQRMQVDADGLAVLHHHPAAHHHGMHAGAVLGMHQLVGGVVAGNPVDVVEVDEDEIGLVALGDAAEPVAEAQRAGAAGGGRLQDLLAGEPLLVVRALARWSRRQPTRSDSYMFWLSQQEAPSVPMPTLSFFSSISLTAAMPLPSSMLLPGLCATEAPWSASRVMSSPSSHTPCAATKSGPSSPRSCKVRRWCLAVLLEPDDNLHLGFLHVAVQADAVLARQVARRRA